MSEPTLKVIELSSDIHSKRMKDADDLGDISDKDRFSSNLSSKRNADRDVLHKGSERITQA